MITRRMQLQSIADRLANVEQTAPNLDHFDPIYKTLYEAAKLITDCANPEMTKNILLGALKGRRDAEHIVQAILATPAGNGDLKFRSIDEIADGMPPLKWFWPGWMATGMLSLLGAQKGAGKTYLMLDLCNRVIKNTYFPDMQPVNFPDAKVIYVDAEFIPQVINDRIKGMGMDRRRFFTLETDIKNPVDFSTQRDRDTLVEMLYAIRPALVVLDSLGNLQSKGENSVEDVRDLMQFLVVAAYEFKCPFVLIHHLRKKNPLAIFDLISLDDFRGSGHIVNMARTIMALSIIQSTSKHNPNGPRRFEVINTNLARYPEPLGVEFKPMEPNGVLLDYGEAPDEYHEPSQEDRTRQWLLDVLDDGPKKPEDLVALAKSQIGVSRATVFRAHLILEKMGLVADTLNQKNPQNEWKLKNFQAVAATRDNDNDANPPDLLVIEMPANEIEPADDWPYNNFLDNSLGGYDWEPGLPA